MISNWLKVSWVLLRGLQEWEKSTHVSLKHILIRTEHRTPREAVVSQGFGGSGESSAGQISVRDQPQILQTDRRLSDSRVWRWMCQSQESGRRLGERNQASSNHNSIFLLDYNGWTEGAHGSSVGFTGSAERLETQLRQEDHWTTEWG